MKSDLINSQRDVLRHIHEDLMSAITLRSKHRPRKTRMGELESIMQLIKRQQRCTRTLMKLVWSEYQTLSIAERNLKKRKGL